MHALPPSARTQSSAQSSTSSVHISSVTPHPSKPTNNTDLSDTLRTYERRASPSSDDAHACTSSNTVVGTTHSPHRGRGLRGPTAALREADAPLDRRLVVPRQRTHEPL